MGSTEKNVVLILAGPTGAGKTDLSTLISDVLPVEIISADSRQIYKYMDIGTAKPSKAIIQKVKHFFIDILYPDQNYSAGQFGNEARQVIQEIFKRNKIPLIVGGSGLYIKALREGFFQDNIRDEKIRTSLQKRLLNEGAASLYSDLLKLDKPSAEKIHPNNGSRIVRALEVFLICGKRLSDLQKNKIPPPSFQTRIFGINKERKKLYSDINSRVDEMIDSGLVAETAHILDLGYEKNLNSLNTVGYKEMIRYLEGNCDFTTCVTEIKQNTRRYAKRQLTWFRADDEIHWINIESGEDYKTATKKICESYTSLNENV